LYTMSYGLRRNADLPTRYGFRLAVLVFFC
jgi:hypothetical protein